MKSKFAGLNFDSVEVLTQEEKKKVKGGYDMYNTSGGGGLYTGTSGNPSVGAGLGGGGCIDNGAFNTNGSSGFTGAGTNGCPGAPTKPKGGADFNL